jgi:hypothetical protein
MERVLRIMTNSEPTEPTQQPAEYIDLPENLPGDDRTPAQPRQSEEHRESDELEELTSEFPQDREHSFGIRKGLGGWLRISLNPPILAREW